jgi:hypothetical protein
VPLAIKGHYPCPAVRWQVESRIEVLPKLNRHDGNGTGSRVLPGSLNGVGPGDAIARAFCGLAPEHCHKQADHGQDAQQEEQSVP